MKIFLSKMDNEKEDKKYEKEKGETPLYLNIGDPIKYDWRTPDFMVEALCDATKNGVNGYSPSEGIDDLRLAAAEKEKRVNNIEIDPSRIIVTSGVSEAIQFLAGALVEQNSEFLVPGPSYPPYIAYMGYFGGLPVTYRTIEDDDGGLTVDTRNVTISNVAPTVNIDGSLKMFEGSPVDLTATSTDPGSDDLKFTWEFELGPTIVHIFYNDGIGPDPLPSPLGIYPFTITDTSGYLYGDDGFYEIKLTVEDDDGDSTTYTDFIEVQNVAPSVEVEAYALVDFTLRIAGEKWHDVRLYIYEDDVRVGSVGVVRYPGSPNDQSVTISNVKCHVTAAINATVYYTPDDDPINGQRNGANPCWIKIGFEDGSYEILKHTFNVRHPETWEWNIGMNHYFVGHKITFKAETTDPGSDDLTCTWNWGDGSSIVSTTYYNDGLGPDPYPSPWGIYPCTENDMKEHTYTTAGNYIATLTVTDDDGGTVVYTLNINLS